MSVPASKDGRGNGSPGGGGPIQRLRDEVAEAAASLRGGAAEPSPTLERPPRAEFGDYSTNVALLLAPALKAPPREIAQQVGDSLSAGLGEVVERVEVAGPGFLNMFLADSWFRRALTQVREAGARFGAGVVPADRRQRILVEFVSANPTGPVTVASGRHAAYGDSLCRVLALAGNTVEREFYVNDYGTQVELFGQSIAARMRNEEPPEDGYQGAYVAELAAELAREGIGPEDLDRLTKRGVELMVERIRASLERFRVHFDRFYSEGSLHDRDVVGAALAELDQDHVYESDGATWMRTTSFGDDKDRVLRRSSGELTYFASDIAYHADKRARGYDRLINVLGADHHGYVARMKALFESLGDPDRFEAVIMQLVQVVERGERSQMSKRKGEFVTLDELVDDIGVDAARFFLLQRTHDTALDLDLDLARERSQENPVYYVQYAHARISSILRKVGDERVAEALGADLTAGSSPLEPAERALVKRLLEFPEEVREAGDRRAPHRLTTYAHDVAADFHAFYRDCRVVGAEPRELEDFRVSLCAVAKSVIARTLDLLGVEAPEQM
jgi:arginyl-tRNA synthetase